MPRATSSAPMFGTGVPSLSLDTCSCTTGLPRSVKAINYWRNTYKNASKPAESKCSICTELAMFVATPPGSTPLHRIPSLWNRHATFLVAPTYIYISLIRICQSRMCKEAFTYQAMFTCRIGYTRACARRSSLAGNIYNGAFALGFHGGKHRFHHTDRHR